MYDLKMTARNVNRNLNDKKGGKEQISVLHGDHNALRRYYEEIRALHQVWDSILRKQQDIEIGKIG